MTVTESGTEEAMGAEDPILQLREASVTFNMERGT